MRKCKRHAVDKSAPQRQHIAKIVSGSDEKE